MKRELLFSVTKKDLEITTFSGTGAGGQHRNRHMNCVRIAHRPSGAIVTAQEERSLEQNKRAAIKRLALHPAFRAWVNAQVQTKHAQQAIETAVDAAMAPENLLIEAQEPDGTFKEFSAE